MLAFLTIAWRVSRQNPGVTVVIILALSTAEYGRNPSNSSGELLLRNNRAIGGAFGFNFRLKDEAGQVGQVGWDAGRSRRPASDAPRHPAVDRLLESRLKVGAKPQSARDVVRKVAVVAAVEKVADRLFVASRRCGDFSQSRRPSFVGGGEAFD
jgi:hypothetical protein